MKHIISAIIFMASLQFFAQMDTKTENKWTGNRPDAHAPITVMGDHTHGKGEFMVSYRFMSMNMEGLIAGEDNIDNSSILIPNGGLYMVAPTKMPMNMHMLGAMFAPTDRITLMVMANYMDMEMDHLTAMGGTFKTTASGFGDTKAGLLYRFLDTNKARLHAQVGLSIPTGSIDNMDEIPASNGNEVILPYPMQIGSGTFDAELGMTFLKQGDKWSFGSQMKSVIRTGKNDNDYRLGNRFNLNTWFGYVATNWLSLSARLEGVLTEEIEGANPALNPMMVITADTNNSGGKFINSGLGFNIYVPKGALKNIRFGFEWQTPLLQDANGIQMKTKDTFTLGLQYSL